MSKNKAFLILCAVISLFSGTYIFASHSSRFCVSQIRIKGNAKVASAEIIKKAEWCMGVNIFSLELERIEERLRMDPRIKHAMVKRRLPGSILVEVKEKVPVLWMHLPPGSPGFGSCGFYGLSIDQEIIPLDQEDLVNDLAIVSGIEIEPGDGQPNQPAEPYRVWSNLRAEKALKFYKTVNGIDPTSVELLAEINLEDLSNLTLYLLPGTKVMLGQGDFQRKWRRLKTVLGGEERIAEIICLDLRFDDQVVLTRSSKAASLLGH